MFRNGREILKYIPRLIKYNWENRFKGIYLLSVGKFAANDYKKFGLFRKKAFKWGYFPKTVEYEDIDSLVSQKTENSILWVGRFLKLKHPEVCFEIAKRLKQDGYSFVIDMLGPAKYPDKIKEMIEEAGVSDKINLLGSVRPEQVRAYMEKAELFLFTSDEREGWGAVVNEAMNSGCVVISSDAAGATSYLIEDGQNGFCYKSGDVDELYSKIKSVLDDENMRKSISKKAYETMKNDWDADVAAERLLALIDAINNKQSLDLHESGPCSRA